MPRILERVLPHFDAEGEGIAKELELTDWPEQAERMAIAADDVSVARSGLDLVTGFAALVPNGGVLVVRSDDAAAGAALVAAICGRYPVASGTLKVAGLVLPTRAAAVRARSALVPLRASRSPADDVRRALAPGVELLGLCDLDAVGEARERSGLARALGRARNGIPHGRGKDAPPTPVTIVASCSPSADVSDLVGDADVVEVTIDAPVAAPPDLLAGVS
ncbi:hypothetical protein [Humibacter ginsenosidimutans]|uniref:Uncharacterized protein n=1 Tax=Humibacter ginsenosidimutans TaxID=2599293 RepID=A0A5B8M4W5_9MICO|nr:hypothetical protein [Humibacter ginsenosidimutans]QDZ15383.1 hypothetical protein FPZ11_11980 [Humibacter ginsenosidimutans]